MMLPELEFEKFLGKGSFGSVSLFKYSEPRTAHYTAVKTSDLKHAWSLDKEFKILSRFKGCSRIVQCYENRVRENDDGEGGIEYMMLMEYASGGSLRTFMERFKDKKLPDPLIREFTRMLLEGLATIHEHGYVHSDLKPGNILVFPRRVFKNGEWRTDYELKISDFGLSKKDGDSEWWTPRRPFAGTRIYMSPESVSHGETGKGLDLWSLGCVVLEMYTGKKPWWNTSYDFEYLEKCYETLIPSDLPCDTRHFIMTCLALETEERRDALTLLEHRFVRGDVKKIIEKDQVNVKTEDSREIALKLEKIEQTLSQIRSTSKRARELKDQMRPKPPSLVPLHHCHLAEPSQKFWFFIRSSI